MSEDLLALGWSIYLPQDDYSHVSTTNFRNSVLSIDVPVHMETIFECMYMCITQVISSLQNKLWSKPTNPPIIDRNNKWSIFHCHVWLPEGIFSYILGTCWGIHWLHEWPFLSLADWRLSCRDSKQGLCQYRILKRLTISWKRLSHTIVMNHYYIGTYYE